MKDDAVRGGVTDEDVMPDGSPGTDPDAAYRRRRQRFAADRAVAARRSRALSWARLAVALAALFLLLSILLEAQAPSGALFGGLTAAVAVFVVLAVIHDRVLDDERRLGERVAIQEEGLARRERRWADLPPAPVPPPDLLGPDGEPPPRARDLGLFGPASLARLLSTPRTPAGRATLARWLLDPGEPEAVRRRQPAVAELATAIELRQRLELAGRSRRGGAAGAGKAGAGKAVGEGGDLDAFLAWAEGEPWLLERRGLVWTSRLLPLVTLAVGVAALAGVVPGALAALVPIAALVLTWLHRGRLDDLFERVAAGPEELATYAAALDALTADESSSFAAPRLRELVAELATGGVPASRWMRRLARRVESADARHGSFHVFNQVLTLWDFHTLWLLERWQVSAGRRLRGWLAALGELEALAALATLSWDQPGWTFPRLVPATGVSALVGRDLGHPLIADAARVGNDVTVGPPGSFLLVTGSNMSGKSTLLRALGVNVVLAQAGGPVCAAALTLPPLVLGTSILVEDSLADGVSFFYAELLRLKQVVDDADATRGGGRILLYLLDEVLRGTNSRERRVAVTRILRHLVAAGAIGAISTHDLELAGEPEIAAAARAVHFRETVVPRSGRERARMTFDYVLRPGPATTTNALALLAAVGLDEAPT